MYLHTTAKLIIFLAVLFKLTGLNMPPKRVPRIGKTEKQRKGGKAVAKGGHVYCDVNSTCSSDDEDLDQLLFPNGFNRTKQTQSLDTRPLDRRSKRSKFCRRTLSEKTNEDEESPLVEDKDLPSGIKPTVSAHTITAAHELLEELQVKYKKDAFYFKKDGSGKQLTETAATTFTSRARQAVVSVLNKYCGTLTHQCCMIQNICTTGETAGIGLALGMMKDPTLEKNVGAQIIDLPAVRT
jgi:hypothetical protein